MRVGAKGKQGNVGRSGRQIAANPNSSEKSTNDPICIRTECLGNDERIIWYSMEFGTESAGRFGARSAASWRTAGSKRFGLSPSLAVSKPRREPV